MKRMLIAAVLLGVSISLAAAGSAFTQSTTEELISTLTAAQEAARKDQVTKAYRLSRDAERHWQAAHATLRTYQQHIRLESIDQSLAILPDLAQPDSLDQFASECARGKLLAQDLQISDLPLLQNIL